MPSPFPGMDPYLEHPAVFHDFHNALSGEIRNELNRCLPSRYYAKLDSRQEIGIVDERYLKIIKPDVAITHDPASSTEGGGVALLTDSSTRTEISPCVEFDIEVEPQEPTFVEIRDANSQHELVTLIEILSPSNKLTGNDRNDYLAKRAMILTSRATLIELDLLRLGEHAWNEPDYRDALAGFFPPPQYLVAINRSWRRTGEARRAYQLFLVRLRDLLPVIPIPLRQGEAEPTLDLQYIFNLTYDSGPYRRGAVKYSDPPPPPAFAPEDYEWVKLQTQKLVSH
jgi:hypothetical protein